MDASQGAEEMLEHLTDKVLHQEEQIQQLDEEKNDLVSSTQLHSFVLLFLLLLSSSMH